MWVSFSVTIVVGIIVVGVNDVRTISLLVTVERGGVFTVMLDVFSSIISVVVVVFELGKVQ